MTDTVARSAKTRDKAYKLSDAKGLYLLINPNGSKLWCLKYRFNGREKKLSIGPYPDVSLAIARERQLGARSLLEVGVDPGEFKNQAKRAASIAGANTFEAIAR